MARHSLVSVRKGMNFHAFLFPLPCAPRPPLFSPKVDVTKSIMALNGASPPFFFVLWQPDGFEEHCIVRLSRRHYHVPLQPLKRLGQVKRCIAPQDGFKRAAAFLSMTWGNFGWFWKILWKDDRAFPSRFISEGDWYGHTVQSMVEIVSDGNSSFPLHPFQSMYSCTSR